MDINQIKAFLTVANTGNLTQASEKLFLSQPAVSAQIKAIENHIGTPLFIRSSSGMTLTRAGEALLPEAEKFLQEKRKLDQFAKKLSAQTAPSADLGLIHPANPHKVTQLTTCIINHNPDVQLHIHYGMSGEILSRILAKKLHGGFFLGQLNQRSLQTIFLENIAYALICHQKDEARLLAGLPQSLNEFTWIEMSGISGSHKNLQQFWQRNKLLPKKQLICDYPQTIVDLVCEGIGVAIVPKHKAVSALQDGKPIAMIEQFEQSLPMSFVFLDELAQDPALVLLREQVESVWQIV